MRSEFTNILKEKGIYNPSDITWFMHIPENGYILREDLKTAIKTNSAPKTFKKLPDIYNLLGVTKQTAINWRKAGKILYLKEWYYNAKNLLFEIA